MNETFSFKVRSIKSNGDVTCTTELLLLLLILNKLSKANKFNYILLIVFLFYHFILFQITISLTWSLALSIAKLPLMRSLMMFMVTYLNFTIFWIFFVSLFISIGHVQKKVALHDIAKIEKSQIFVLFENEASYKDFFCPQVF